MEKKFTEQVSELSTRHSDHRERMASIETCQQNTANRLNSIEETTKDTNAKVDQLIMGMLNKGQ